MFGCACTVSVYMDYVCMCIVVCSHIDVYVCYLCMLICVHIICIAGCLMYMWIIYVYVHLRMCMCKSVYVHMYAHVYIKYASYICA